MAGEMRYGLCLMGSDSTSILSLTKPLHPSFSSLMFWQMCYVAMNRQKPMFTMQIGNNYFYYSPKVYAQNQLYI